MSVLFRLLALYMIELKWEGIEHFIANEFVEEAKPLMFAKQMTEKVTY